jgi:hypothetical protein
LLPKLGRFLRNAPPSALENGSAALYWLLSLYSPAAADKIDWSGGNYSLTLRGGRVESHSGPGAAKKDVRMVNEGCVLAAGEEPVGAAVDVAPEGFAHPVYRSGLAMALRLPVVEVQSKPIEEPSTEEAVVEEISTSVLEIIEPTTEEPAAAPAEPEAPASPPLPVEELNPPSPPEQEAPLEESVAEPAEAAVEQTPPLEHSADAETPNPEIREPEAPVSPPPPVEELNPPSPPEQEPPLEESAPKPAEAAVEHSADAETPGPEIREPEAPVSPPPPIEEPNSPSPPEQEPPLEEPPQGEPPPTEPPHEL